jgi:Spy/CpxP family protein refolding chaperone
MKRAAFILALILLAGRFEAFAQDQGLEDEIRAKLAEAEANLQIAQLNRKPQSTFDFSQSFKPKTTPTDALQTGLNGTWWREASWIKALELTPDQRKKMDDAFLQNKIRLIDLSAALEKEETLLEPLVENIRPEDEAKILAQIDKVADARAGLEKANARWLLAMRQILSQDQWSKVQASRKKSIFGSGFNVGVSPWAAPVPAAPATK